MTAVGADPGVYEAWLGEATELMLDQAGVGPGSRVLDVAAGAGGQTLTAARRTGPDGILLATDISEPLLDRVRAGALAEEVSHVYAAVADAAALDFMPGAFDAAICRLGLMHLPDVAARIAGHPPRAAARRPLLDGRLRRARAQPGSPRSRARRTRSACPPASCRPCSRTPGSSTSRSSPSTRRCSCRTTSASRSGCSWAAGGGHDVLMLLRSAGQCQRARPALCSTSSVRARR